MRHLKSINELYGSGSSPNPRKTINVNFNIDDVKKSISKISGDYRLIDEDDILNQYKFENYEFLNLGSYAFINLDEINENRTSITIEIIRKIGSFNLGSELYKANQHINSLFSVISKYLKNPDIVEDKSDDSDWSDTEISLLDKNGFEKKEGAIEDIYPLFDQPYSKDSVVYYVNSKEGIDVIKMSTDDDVKLRNLISLSGKIEPVGKKFVFQYRKLNPNYKSMKFIKKLVNSSFYKSNIFNNLSDCIKESLNKKF